MNQDALNKIMTHYSVETNSFEEENKLLKETINSLRAELDKFNRPPLLVAEVKDVLGDNMLIRLNNGNDFFVDAASGCPKLKPGDSVLIEQKNLTILKKIDSASKTFNVEKFVIIEKPTVSWENVGGLKKQEEEIKEVIELPLKKPELFKKVGIQPPKGILLHGPPGTGKTLLAKAVAASTNSTFIEIVGSELVQKFIGEGTKLVKEVFALAREKAPSIIFIDEIDAIAATRVEIGTSGEREVQRTFMQLLAEVDGFKHLGNVKIIGCTNRKDILDAAITRPGRLDRLIYVPLPDVDGIREIFKIHTKNMKITKGTNLNKVYVQMKGFSGAEIRAVCTEAGYFAIRDSRFSVNIRDFMNAVDKVKEKEKIDKEVQRIFG